MARGEYRAVYLLLVLVTLGESLHSAGVEVTWLLNSHGLTVGALRADFDQLGCFVLPSRLVRLRIRRVILGLLSGLELRHGEELRVRNLCDGVLLLHHSTALQGC